MVTTMLCIAPGGLVAARHPRQPEYRLRVLDAQRDAGRLFDLESTDAGAFDPAGYRRYLQRQWQRYRTLQDRGQMHWFGIEFDGRLVASCGLIRAEGRPGEAARFQRVITHPDFRRRGLASALVRAVTSFAFDQWRAPAVYMAADAEGIAVGLYRSLGYRGISSAWGLQCNAPEDRRA
jgi:ribosomal protein S18 acetylase RimI-like enzyme